MNKYTYPISSSTWDDKENQAIINTLKSGNLTMGKKVLAFEKKFSNYLKTKYCIMVNSGSSANLLMVASLFYLKNKHKLNKGDEVIVPAVSWSTSYYPFYQYGLKLKFVDIDIDSLNYNLNSLKKAISSKTKVILAVNLCGNPNDFTYINKIIKDKNILVLEDNCESLGAEFNNKKTGSFGLMSSCSFYYSHHISTMEGGMISTNSLQLFKILVSLRAHGWTRELIKKSKKNNFQDSFNFILPGYNLRPIEFSGAAGIEQLKKLPKFIANRRANAKLFIKYFKDNKDLIIQKEIGKSSWFWFTFIVRPGCKNNREYYLNKLFNAGFETRPIVAGNFTLNKVVKYLNYRIFSKLTNANYLHKNGFAIGNQHFNEEKKIKKLAQILK